MPANEIHVNDKYSASVILNETGEDVRACVAGEAETIATMLRRIVNAADDDTLRRALGFASSAPRETFLRTADDCIRRIRSRLVLS